MHTYTLEEKKQFANQRGYTLVSDKNVSKKDRVILIENSTGREFRSHWGSFRDGSRPTRTTLAQKKKETLAKGYELLEEDEELLTSSIAKFRNLKTGAIYETRYNDFHVKGYREKDYSSIPKGEAILRGYLTTNLVKGVTFKYQYRVTLNDRYLFFDFALFKGDDVIGFIEYNGIQHYSTVTIFGEDAYSRTVESDKLKKEYAEQVNVPLLAIPYKVYQPQRVAETVQDFFPIYTFREIHPFEVLREDAYTTTLEEKKQLAKERGYELLETENFYHRDKAKLRNLTTGELRETRWQSFINGSRTVREFAVRRRKSSLEDKKNLAKAHGYELLETDNFSVKKVVTLKEVESGITTTIRWENFEKRYKKKNRPALASVGIGL